MDEDLRLHLEAMEKRLMRRINGNHESMLATLRELRADLRDLRSEHSVTRDTVLKLPMTVIGALEMPLLQRIRATEARLDQLEKPKDTP